VDELLSIVRSLEGNSTKEEIREMISEVDIDGNGRSVNFENFLKIMGRTMKVTNRNHVKKLERKEGWGGEEDNLSLLIVNI